MISGGRSWVILENSKRSFNGVRLCSDGGPDRPRDEVDLTPRSTLVLIDLKAGDHEATILTTDLTHDYVHENSAYSS